MATAGEVAAFMVAELERTKFLYQETIAYEILSKFGDAFTGINANGNLSINKDVLAIFNDLTPDHVWERGERMWRARAPYDKPGRQQ